MRHIINFFLLILLSANLFAQNKFPLVTDYYHLKLSFDFKEELMKGSCEMKIENESDTTFIQIPVLLYRLMKVESVQNQANENLSFTQSVTQFEDFPKLQANYIVIQEKILPYETKIIKIHYSGYLLGYEETGMRYKKDKISPDFTIIRNDAYSYPVIGKPSISFLRENIAAHYFEYKIEVTVPDSLIVANGGILESIRKYENNLSTFQYASKKPNWRIDIAIAPYKKLFGDRLEIFYITDSLAAADIADYGEKAMSLYTYWWGELKNKNTITVIETEKGSGGQTDETTILLPEEAFTSKNDYEYLYHELSHLWNVKIAEEKGLSPRWEEGLATFCQYLVTEKLNPEKAGLVKRASNNVLKRLKSNFEKNPKLLNTPMFEFGNEQLTNYSYTQAMVMFSVLYYWLGEESFNQAISGFYQKYYKAGTTTRDFTNYWEKSMPSERLKNFFNDWVYGTEYTTFILNDRSIDEIINHYKL
jgi:hypothetical protein